MAAKRYQAGTVFLQVVPSMYGFQRTVKEQSKGLAKGLEKDGSLGGESWGEGFNKGLSKGFAESSKKTDKWARDFQGRIVESRKVLGNTHREMSQALKAIGQDFENNAITAEKAAKRIEKVQRALATKAANNVNGTPRSRENAGSALAALIGSKKEADKLIAEVDRANRKASADRARFLLEEDRKAARARLEAARGNATRLAEIAARLEAQETKLTKAGLEERNALKRKAIDDRLAMVKDELKATKKAQDDIAREEQNAIDAVKKADAKAAKDRAKFSIEQDRMALRARLNEARNSTSALLSLQADLEREKARLVEAGLAEQDDATRKSIARRLSMVRQEAADTGVALRAAQRNDAGKAARPTRPADTGGNVASRGVMRLTGMLTGQRDAQDGANAFRAFNAAILAVAVLGPILIPVLAAIGGAIAAMIPILAGAVAGLGVFALGLSGIRGAVEAMAKVQKASNKSSLAYSNSVRDAGKAARRSAQQIAAAERALAKAHRQLANARRDGARMIENALERQQKAERNLMKAQRDAIKAQEDLVKARIQAAKDIRDLQNDMSQNRLDERTGVITVFQAQTTYDATMRDAGATNIEREQAAIALEQARLSLKQIREAQGDMGEAWAEIEEHGIEGTDRVKNAQEELTEAIYREGEARKDVADAARDLDDARRDSAERIRDAIDAIRDAEERLANAREDGADAQRRLSQAVRGGATAIDELNDAMEKLSPAGQRFAKWIYSLGGYFDRLRKSAQEGLLPGLQAGLEQIMAVYGSGFQQWVRDMSTDLGDLMRLLGQRFTSGGFPEFFREFGEASRQFTLDALLATTNWIEAFANIFVVARPYLHEFSTWLLGLSERFKNWTASEAGQEALTRFFDGLAMTLPAVGTFLGKAGDAFAALAPALNSIGIQVMEMLGNLFDKISNAKPETLEKVAAALIGLLIAFQVSTGLVALITAIGVITGAPLIAAVGALVALGAALYLLGDNEGIANLKKDFEPLLKIFGEIGTVVKEQLMDTWNNVMLPGLSRLGELIKEELLPSIERFWDVFGPFILWIVKGLGEMLRTALSGVFSILGGLIKFISGLLDVIVGVFTGDWDLVWDGLEKIFFGLGEMVWGAIQLIFVIGPGKILKTGLKVIGGIFSGLIRIIGAIFRTAWKFVSKPLTKMMDDIGGFFSKRIESIKKIFNTVKDTIASLIPKKVMDSLKKAFEKLKGFIVDPIKVAVNLVINGGIFAAIRKIKDLFGIGDKNTPKNITFGNDKGGGGTGGGRQTAFHTGGIVPGYTPGRDVVNARLSGGEAIMRPEWTRVFGPEWVERMNAAARNGGVKAVQRLAGFSRGGIMPVQRFAKGGIVNSNNQAALIAAANWWISKGARGSRHPRFGGAVRSGHSKGSLHYVDKAVDLNFAAGTSAYEQRKFDQHLPAFRRLFPKIRVIWRAPGHYNHMHIDTGKGGGGGFIGALGNALKKGWDTTKDFLSSAKDLATPALGKILNPIKGKAGKGSFIKDFFKIPGKFLKKILDFGLSKIIPGHKGPSKLYDNGGWIKPGHTMVHNASGRPEPVFSAEQWEIIKRSVARGAAGGTGGEQHFHLEGTGATPEQLAGAINRVQRREARRVSSRLPE